MGMVVSFRSVRLQLTTARMPRHRLIREMPLARGRPSRIIRQGRKDLPRWPKRASACARKTRRTPSATLPHATENRGEMRVAAAFDQAGLEEEL